MFQTFYFEVEIICATSTFDVFYIQLVLMDP